MVTICDRTAYAPLAIGGEGEATDVPSTLRITFDENVAYRDLFEEALTARASHRRSPVGFGMPRPLLPADEAIMEVKCAGPFPLWLVDALDGCEAYPSRFPNTVRPIRRACARRRKGRGAVGEGTAGKGDG